MGKTKAPKKAKPPGKGSPLGKRAKVPTTGLHGAPGTPLVALAPPLVDPIFGFPTNFEIGTAFNLPLWPKWNQTVLKQEYRKGAWTFDLGFRQKTRSEENRVFNLDKFCRTGVLVNDLVNPGDPHFGGFDPAGEKRIGNALITVIATNGGALRVIKEVRLWKGLYAETATEITMADHRHRYALLVLENTSLQGMMIDLVRSRDAQIPMVGYQTGMQKAHPQLGLPGLAEEIKAGLWVLCVDDDYGTGLGPLASHEPGCECPYHVLLADLAGYPTEARTYDCLMALWFVRQGVRGDFADKGIAFGSSDDIDHELFGELPIDDFGGNFLTAS